MKLKLSQIATILAVSTLLIGFQNCAPNKYAYAVAEQETTAASKSCTNVTTQSAAEEMRILFVIDQSGSNKNTDPTKKWREQALRSILNKYKYNSKFAFGFITFSVESARSLVYHNDRPAFTKSSQDIEDALGQFLDSTDEGGTPYKSALSLSKQMISYDKTANNGDAFKYSVVLISDGQPSDYSRVSELTADAKAILAISADHIVLNSVFYYDSNIVGSNAGDFTKYLAEFANLGSGKFVVANTNQSLDMNNLISMTSLVCN